MKHDTGRSATPRAPALLRVLTALLLLALPAGGASAQELQIAQVKKVTGKVTVLRADRRLPVAVGDPLFEKDVIETGADGGVGLTFRDNTVFSAGPDSQLALDQFHFDSSNFRGQMLADIRKGTLTVVSGDIARTSPEAMKIKTPTATLAVRGTTFAVQVY